MNGSRPTTVQALPPSPLYRGERAGVRGCNTKSAAALHVARRKERAPEVTVRLVKVIARTALALVWIYEGLVPKLLYVTQSEVDLVERSRLYWPTPAATLTALAVGEILGGLWLLSGKAERTAAALSLLLTITLGTLCAVHEPALLHHPFGGLSKNLCLIACALVVYLLSRVTPNASRAAHADSAVFNLPRPRHPEGGLPTEGSRAADDASPLPEIPRRCAPRDDGANVGSPFAAALGATLGYAAPLVRDHFLHADGVRHYRGVMTRVWRRRDGLCALALPALWLARLTHTLFPDTGENVPFDLEHAVERLPDGSATVRFARTFHFPRTTRRFAASLTYNPTRRCLSDRLGRGGLLDVELHPWVEAGELRLRSGRQFLRLGNLKLPVPHWLAGHARVREYEAAGNRLGIEVVISNRLLGDFFGYEGAFTEVGGSDAAAADKAPGRHAEGLRSIPRPFSKVPSKHVASVRMPDDATPDPNRAPKAPTPAHRQWKGSRALSPTSDNPRAAGKVKWLTRAALFLVASVGTATYAASFRLPRAGIGDGVVSGVDAAAMAAAMAAVVGVAAAASWPVFGLALLRLTRGRPGAWPWADACLRTMACGAPVLCAAALWNASLAAAGACVSAAAFLGAHAACLVGANALMGAAFVRHAARLGLRPRSAVAAWVLALDAPFLALVVWFTAFFNRTGVV